MKLKSGKRWETNIGSEVRECLKKNQVGGEGSDEGAILDRVGLRLQEVGEAMQLWWVGRWGEHSRQRKQHVQRS